MNTERVEEIAASRKRMKSTLLSLSLLALTLTGAALFNPPAMAQQAWICQSPGTQLPGQWDSYMYQVGDYNKPIAWTNTVQCDRFTYCSVNANCQVNLRARPVKFLGWCGQVTGYESCCLKTWNYKGGNFCVRAGR